MARKRSGSIEEHCWADGRTVTWRARVRAYGRQWRVQFGSNHEGWSQGRAQVELDRILAQIERGTWEPPAAREQTDDAAAVESIHVTTSRWWQLKQGDIGEKTREDYMWRIGHLLAYRPHTPTDEIDARWVDGLREHLLARRLSPRSVNMVLGLLAMVLDRPVRYGLLSGNPARAKGTMCRVPKSPRAFLAPDMVVDVLDAAGAWERDLPPHQRYGRRAFLAVLLLAGPRISEPIEASRGGLDIPAGTLRLGKKTVAGTDRTLELSAFLLDELSAHLAAVPARLREAQGPALPLFPTWRGGRLCASNIRNRLLYGTPARNGRQRTKGVLERVNEKRAREGRMLLPTKVTPHTFRRTFASLCFFAGRDIRWVMGQLGHDDARVTLEVYAQCMQRAQVDEATVWRLMRFRNEEEVRGGAGQRPRVRER